MLYSCDRFSVKVRIMHINQKIDWSGIILHSLHDYVSNNIIYLKEKKKKE